MKKSLLLLLPLLAGCFTSSSASSVSHWPIEYVGKAQARPAAALGLGRITQVVVRTPYNDDGIVVLRKNGTVETDAYNEFVAQPSFLLKGVVFDAMEASGAFSSVLNASSSVVESVSVEVMVTRLALDCRREGAREAVVALVLRIVKDGALMQVEKGEGSSDAEDGDYGAAFSRAVSAALSAAFGNLR